MTDLRTAAQQALEALEMSRRFVYADSRPQCDEAIAALHAALAQQDEPVEPVAWMVYTEGGASAYVTDNPRDLIGAYRALALYTTPPQRKPLAEWQINDLMAGIDPEDVCSWSFRQGVYAAEKHHGIGERP